MRVRKIFLGLFPAIMAGCSAQPVVLDHSYAPTSKKDTHIARCLYHVVEIRDIRADKDSLGRLGGTRVSSTDVLAWVSNALDASGFTSCDADEENKLIVSLKLAHTKSSSTSKVTNVVLGVEFNDKPMRYIRGSHAGINWSSSAGEIKSSFNQALGETIQKMAIYANGECN